jgi:hypothetical protein
VLQELRIEVDASRCGNSDDNKENVSSAPSEEALDNSSHYGSEIRLLENNDNVPLKENVALKVTAISVKCELMVLKKKYSLLPVVRM